MLFNVQITKFSNTVLTCKYVLFNFVAKVWWNNILMKSQNCLNYIWQQTTRKKEKSKKNPKNQKIFVINFLKVFLKEPSNEKA